MLKRASSSKLHPRLITASLLIALFFTFFFIGKFSVSPNEVSILSPLSSPVNHQQYIKKRSTTPLTSVPSDPNEPWIEIKSWEPRIFVYHNFLAPIECEEIVNLGSDSVTRSEVVSKEGNGRVDSHRTSFGVFLTEEFMKRSPLLRDIERRIAEWTHLPIENGEAYYLLRYEIGQYYKAHTDYFPHDEIGQKYIGDYGNRYATVLTYLHTPEEGGSTDFPQAGITVPVKAGDAVLFYDLTPSNTDDPLTQHASLPVTKGVKWAMTKWIREKAFHRWDGNLADDEKQQYRQLDKQWMSQHYQDLQEKSNNNQQIIQQDEIIF